MKLTTLILCLLSALTLSAFDMTPYKRIVCLGDSITNGGVYDMYLQSYLAETDPATPRRVINRGIGGDTVPKLLRRVNKVLKEDKPDLVFIMIGINDLQFTTRFAKEDKNLPFDKAVKKYKVFNRFDKELGQLVDILKKAKVKVVILATPPYNESTLVKTKVNQHMNTSGVRNLVTVGKRLAKRKGVEWIDTYTPLLENLQKNEAKFPRHKTDRVHLSGGEHLIIAQTIIGKKYKPGAKIKLAQRYWSYQKQLREVELLMSGIPKSCTTVEARIAHLEKQVERAKGKSWHGYMKRMLPKRINIVKNADKMTKDLKLKIDTSFNKLYQK